MPACQPRLTLPSLVLSFGGRLDCSGDKLLSRAQSAWRNSVAMNHPTNLKEMVGGWVADGPTTLVHPVGRRFRPSRPRDESYQLHHVAAGEGERG